MLRNTPIRRKLMLVTMLTSGAVLLLTCSAFFTYEFFTFRQTTIRQLSTLGEIIATNSTAALAFNDPDGVSEILAALKAEKHIVAASLYDADGNLFAQYPASLPATAFPEKPGIKGYDFSESHLEGFQPVMQTDRYMGTLYLKSDLGAIYDRFRLYGIIVISVVAISFLLAYVLSMILQRQISRPLLALSKIAKAVSEQHDYSVRAVKQGTDELGLLTDAFNHMLTQIQGQTLALRESEARMRAVLNSALSAVVVMDTTGKITDWNIRAEKMFGWSRDEVMGRQLSETIIPQNFQAAHQQGLNRFLTTGEGPVINQLIEISAIRRNGDEFAVELSVSVLKTGDAISFCGFITDITERRRAAEEIRSLNQTLDQKVLERTEELQLANKEMEAFSYSISHDLRAPLRSIHSYMNIFTEDYGSQFDEEGNRLINIVLRNASKMGQLIDDLLDFSKLGKRELQKGDVSMKNMVASIWEDLRKLEGNRTIEFDLHDLPNAHADSGTIMQVWTNLVSNAIKYTRKKEKATIEVGWQEGKKTITYFVKDNGAGFDMNYYNKLFGVFQRLHSNHQFEGTGVGLAIVHRIIVKHGGKIWAEGKIDEGATFYFSLPK